MRKNSYPTPQRLLDCSWLQSTFSKNPPTLIGWEQLAQMIVADPYLAQSTLQARQLLAKGDSKGYSKAKSDCGAFIPAAQFDGGRTGQFITALTGVSMVDFDHVPDDRMADALQQVHSDPHTFMAYTTTSGHGIRVLFRFSCQRPVVAYYDAWLWGNQYYAMLTGLDYDIATKDPTRLSFLCHDEHCYFNAEAQPFSILTSDEALEMASDIDDMPAGAQAADLARHIADKHIPYTEGSRHSHLIYRAFLLNKMGVDADEIASIIEPDCPRGSHEAHGIAQWVAENGSKDFGTWKGLKPCDHSRKRPTMAQQLHGQDSAAGASTPDKSNTRYASPEEVRQYLAEAQQLRYNVVTCMVEMFSPEQQAFVPMNDRTQNLIWHNCNTALGKYVRQNDFAAEINAEFIPAFNPFEDYFHSLPPWDGADHIGSMAQRVTVKDGDTRIPLNTDDPLGQSEPIFAYCFRKWFVAMVASWLDPKVMNETILTFIGKQGIYKSTFFRRLLPPALDSYFLAKGNSSHVTKDDKLAVSSRALVDFEEIDSMRDADLNAVKALVTTEVIDERSPYARNRERHSHLASFCATGNNYQFLTDLTGNRRWLPFEVLSIASPYDYPIDYPQLYAQALALIASGFRYWFCTRENDLLELHKHHFSAPCPEEELIAKYYRQPYSYERGMFVTATEVLARCNADLRMPLRPERIGQVLSKMGIASRTRKGRKGYILTERSFDEINQEKLEGDN